MSWTKGIATAGLLLGLGFGGLFDGVVLHQILQWHHMICYEAHCRTASVELLRRQNYWDGLFHACTSTLAITGVVFLFRAARQPLPAGAGRLLMGASLLGWGVFNLVEGLIDHHWLRIHHVRPGPAQGLWDVLFLLFGALLVLAGWRLARPALARPGTPAPA